HPELARKPVRRRRWRGGPPDARDDQAVASHRGGGMNAVDLSLVEACSPVSRLPVAEIKRVSDWLDAFEADATRHIVIDKAMRLWTDYDRLGGEQNRVALILLDKLQRGQILTVGVTAPAATGTPPNGAHWAHL